VYKQQEEQQEQQQDAENPFLDPPFSRIKIGRFPATIQIQSPTLINLVTFFPPVPSSSFLFGVLSISVAAVCLLLPGAAQGAQLNRPRVVSNLNTGWGRLNATIVQTPANMPNASVLFNGSFKDFQGIILGLRDTILTI
jgi:hypothetical protein